MEKKQKKSKFEKMLDNVDKGQTTLTQCVPRMEVYVKKDDMYEQVI